MSSYRSIKAAFLAPPESIDNVYGQGRRERIAALTELLPGAVCAERLEANLDRLAEAEVFFSAWGIPQLMPRHLDRLPRLRAIFYAAGSVGYFAKPILERGIIVTSAWRANAVPVAEFTLAQMLLSGKGYWRNVQDYDGTQATYNGAPQAAYRGLGNYGLTVALLGAGAIGRYLIALLRPFSIKKIVYDPYLSSEEAAQLGVELVSLEEAFAQGDIVSNHLADKPQTEGMINGALLAQLRPNATFINTGRGRTVNQPEMVEVLRNRPDVMALLDVTNPEPMERDSPLRALPNVRISSHIAGSIGNETLRMADMAIAECERYIRGAPLLDAVTLDMLATLA